MRTLADSLSEHPLALLRGIAEVRQVSLASNARDEVAAQLAAALSDESATAAGLAAASEEARAAFAALQRAGGKLKMAVFARRFGEIRPVGPGRLEREALWREPQSAAEELWYRGLVFRAFADFGDGPMEYIYLPEDLPLPRTTPPPPHSDARPLLPEPAPAPSRARHALNSLAVDACALLAAIREEPLPQTDDPLAAGRGQELVAALAIPDPLRFEMLLALAQGLGWLAPDRGRLVVDNQRVGEWLRLTHWEQMSLLFSAWRDSVAWNDLRRTPGLLAEGEWVSDAPHARKRLLRLLKALDAKGWYRIADVIAVMKRADPDFQRPDGNYSGWYLRETETGRYLSGFESWDAVEGRLLRFLIEGPLFWLGAVALGQGIEDARLPGDPPVFRLTPAGAAWLNARMPAEPPQPAKLSVADDFTVTAPLLLPLLDRYRLARFTDSDTGGHWETRREMVTPAATRHRITRASLARARAAGIKGADALAILRRAAGGRVPPKVAGALERYDQLGGEVRMTRGAVLRVADAATLAALRADSLIAPMLGDLISAQAVVVPEKHVDRLLAILRDSGYTVELS
jgi:hypothetical protein